MSDGIPRERIDASEYEVPSYVRDIASRSFRYRDAIICGIPDSLTKAQTTLKNDSGIDVRKARQQHRNYVEVLRQIGLDVWELEADEKHPDCTFVEDTAVIIGSTALICRIGAPSREDEVIVVRAILQKEFPDIEIVEMKDDKIARLDGGDVLFTGREIFVGESNRTNEQGAQWVAKTFPDYPCLMVKVEGGLHLKTLVTLGGPQTLIAGSSPEAKRMIQKIQSDSMYRYDVIHVPDQIANCLYVNGTLIHKTGYPSYAQIFSDRLKCPKVAVDMSEVAKLEAHLTCCSLLLSSPSRHVRRSNI